MFMLLILLWLNLSLNAFGKRRSSSYRLSPCIQCNFSVAGLSAVVVPNTSFVLEVGGSDSDGFLQSKFKIIDVAPLVMQESEALWYETTFSTKAPVPPNPLLEGFSNPFFCIHDTDIWFVELNSYPLSIFILDTLTWSWRNASVYGIPPISRQLYAKTCNSTHMFFHGGITNQVVPVNTQAFFALDMENEAWIPLPQKSLQTIWNHKIGVLDQYLFLIGGLVSVASFTISNPDVFVFNLNTNQWTNITHTIVNLETGIPERYHGCGEMVYYNASLIVFGGSLYDDSDKLTLSSIHLNNDTFGWKKLDYNKSRAGHDVVMYPNSSFLLSLGGVSTSDESFIQVIDLQNFV